MSFSSILGLIVLGIIVLYIIGSMIKQIFIGPLKNIKKTVPNLSTQNDNKTHENKQNNVELDKVDKELEKIIIYAKKVIDNLRKELDIDYAHLMYEEIFFFFFLNDVKLVDKNTSDDFREKILNRLFESFEYTHNTGYQENRKLIDDIFNLRMKYYAAIYAKYNLNFTADFFMDIFNYQVELLTTIMKNNDFSYYNPVPSTPLEYTKKESIGLYSNSNIMNALTNNIEIITHFIKISE